MTSPDRLLSAIARARGVRETGEEHIETKLLTALTGRDMLLVVDNMEHLLDATGDLVRLVTELPRLQLLVTSRSPLRVRAERTFELGPLDLPDADAIPEDAAEASAVTLFVERATAINPAFRVSEDMPRTSPGSSGPWTASPSRSSSRPRARARCRRARSSSGSIRR